MAVVLVVVVALASLLSGCGKSDEVVDPLLGDVDKARDVQALSSLQQALTFAALVKTESGGSYGSGAEDLAQRLQAKDPSKKFTTAPSAGPEQIQVLGGGGAAMMVAQSQPDSYLAVWDDGNGTAIYYRGTQPPAFSAQRPSGGGWSEQPVR
jgi:hypothetical protein